MNEKNLRETVVKSPTGQMVGYARVSSKNQNLERQVEALKAAGCTKIFEEKTSGASRDRDELEALLDYVREGDLVVCTSMDRLARSLPDLHSLVTEITERGVEIQFLKEAQIYGTESTPIAALMLGLLGSIAQFERALIRDRQAEGIARARQKGLYKGRRPSLSSDQVKSLREMVSAGVPKAEVARRFDISRASVYRYLGLNGSQLPS